MFLFSIDHKAGYLHVPIHKDSWKYLGVFWEGEYYVYTCLPFGTSYSPFVYHTLTDAVARYIRGLGIPMSAYIDDSLGGTEVACRDGSEKCQFASACRAVFVICMVYFYCGYFIGLKKSELYPRYTVKYLGMICDTINQKFWVPSKKAQKLIDLIEGMLDKGETWYRQLESVVGKCASMSVAVPMASLFTREQRATLKRFERPHKRHEGGHKIRIGGKLREELLVWPMLLTELNGASWYKATHFTLRIEGDSDSSSRRYGAELEVPGLQDLVCAAEFDDDKLPLHINAKERKKEGRKERKKEGR